MAGPDEKRRPAALNLTPARPSTSESSSSDGSLKPRTPRFAEATSVHSPVDSRSPFADPEKSHAPQPQPADVGFGYIGNNSNRESIPVPMTPKTPLKSAMKVPGTPAGARNPLSPTFREADILEKQELATEKEQARDVKIKARVRMAKFALRGVNFSCSLIILCMLSATFSIFNATRALPDQSRMPSWAKNTNAWPQKLVLAMACVSLAACIIVFASYCRGGHRRAEKVGTYYTLFAIGCKIPSISISLLFIQIIMASSNDDQKLSKPSEEETKKWGTHLMGAPAAPTVHPDNQQAAHWQAQGPAQQQPYVVYTPVQKPADNPFEYAVNIFNSWSHRAEEIGRNIWHNLKTGPSVSEAAWGKANLTAKAITEGGFESLFKQIFPTDPHEKLKKTFACYLSTSTGPVAGTLYLSTARVAFCSDRPLSFKAPSGQEAWSYYKVTIPLGNIENVNPVVMKEDPPGKYIQIVTVDGHEFWFMGFVNFEKASHHLLDSVSDSRATRNVAQPLST